MTPFGINLLIKPLEKKQAIISDTETFTDCGEVLAVGEDVVGVKVGDIIAFLFWGSQSVSDAQGNKYYFVPCSDEFILGVL